MYSRLQNRLNPVPESLNSPDIAPPASHDGMTRPPRDDPLRVYNRDIRVSRSVGDIILYGRMHFLDQIQIDNEHLYFSYRLQFRSKT